MRTWGAGLANGILAQIAVAARRLCSQQPFDPQIWQQSQPKPTVAALTIVPAALSV